MKRITITLLVLFCLGTSATGQLAVSSQLGYLRTLGPASYGSFGIGGEIQKAFSAKFTIGLSANIYFGGKADYTDTAFAVYASTTPQYVLVDVKRKAISYTGVLEFRYYVAGDAESDMGVYAMLGGGAVKWLIRTKEVGEYDESKYIFNARAGDQGVGSAFGPAFGLGFEKNIGNSYFFANGRFILPILGEADANSGFEKPKTLVVEAGIRFPF